MNRPVRDELRRQLVAAFDKAMDNANRPSARDRAIAVFNATDNEYAIRVKNHPIAIITVKVLPPETIRAKAAFIGIQFQVKPTLLDTLKTWYKKQVSKYFPKIVPYSIKKI